MLDLSCIQGFLKSNQFALNIFFLFFFFFPKQSLKYSHPLLKSLLYTNNRTTHAETQ